MDKSHVLLFPHSLFFSNFLLELILLMFGDLPSQHQLVTINIMFHLWITSANLSSYSPYKINMMFFLSLLSSKLMLNIYVIAKLKLCNLNGVMSFILLFLFFLNLTYLTSWAALIPINTMRWWSTNIDILLRWVSPS